MEPMRESRLEVTGTSSVSGSKWGHGCGTRGCLYWKCPCTCKRRTETVQQKTGMQRRLPENQEVATQNPEERGFKREGSASIHMCMCACLCLWVLKAHGCCPAFQSSSSQLLRR